MNKKILISFSVLLLLVGTQSIVGQQSIKIVGSNTLFPIMESAGARYQEVNPEISISVEGPGSGAGIAALIDGQTDLAPMSRAPKSSELSSASDKGMNINVTVVGLDALIIIVNNANPISSLTHKQITDIYNGTVTNWKDVGGSNAPITVIERDENSGTHDYFNEFFLDKAEVDPTKVSSHKQEASTSQLFQLVAEDENAIGYGGLAYLDNTVTAIDVDGVTPSKTAAASGDYSVARELYVVFDQNTVSNLALDFVEYLLSPEGQYIVDDVGYVAVREMATGLSEANVDNTPGFGFFSVFVLSSIYVIKRRKNN